MGSMHMNDAAKVAFQDSHGLGLIVQEIERRSERAQFNVALKRNAKLAPFQFLSTPPSGME